MKHTHPLVLLVLSVALAVSALAAGSAAAALPELGRCLKVAPVTAGHKKTFDGKYENAACTKPSSRSNGRFEWSSGAGTEKGFESPGSVEAATLEGAKGPQVSCKNSKITGEYTGAKTESVEVDLYECKDLAGEPCQSVRPEETPPTPVEGTILSRPLEAELKPIKPKKAKTAAAGWEYRVKSGATTPDLFVFECDTTTGTGTKVTIEGAFIGKIVKPLNRMSEEFHLAYDERAGKQEPESAEGGSKAVLSGSFLTASLQQSTEQLGYLSPETEQSTSEALEIRASA